MRSNLINPVLPIARNTNNPQLIQPGSGNILSLIAAMVNPFLGPEEIKKISSDIMEIKPEKRIWGDASDAKSTHSVLSDAKSTYSVLSDAKSTLTTVWILPRNYDILENLFFEITSIDDLCIIVKFQNYEWSVSITHLNLLGMITKYDGTYIINIPLVFNPQPNQHSVEIHLQCHEESQVRLKMKYMFVGIRMRDVLMNRLVSRIPITSYEQLTASTNKGIISFILPPNAYKVIIKCEDMNICPSLVTNSSKKYFKKETSSIYSLILNPTINTLFECYSHTNNFHLAQLTLCHHDFLQNPTLQDLRESLAIENQTEFIPFGTSCASESSTCSVVFDNEYKDVTLFVSALSNLVQSQGTVRFSLNT